ncbi:MAG: SPFH domain-containing protein [Actinobacteria bacterium]|nr:SPFH domain-containing protein [Actinomycetota bacterium]MCG2802279.1 SPFH domain-containing protein [Cellulomonas sp.]
MPGLFTTSILLFIVTAIALGVRRSARRARPQPSPAPAPEAPVAEPEAAAPTGKAAGGRPGRKAGADRPRASAPTPGKTSGWVAIVSGTLAVVTLFFSSAVIVSTKNVGIETSFGRPVASLSNGFHLIAPWNVVTEMDAAIQTDNHVKTGDTQSCITVRIAHQATACVDTSIRWRIEESAADGLFRDYRDFANVRDSLVTRDLNAALNAAFEDYDPLAIDKDGNSTSPTLESLSTKVLARIQGEIGEQINVLSVIIPVIHYDDNTQSKVNALLAQVAQTRIAEQAVITAQQQALANQTLAQSVSNDPNVLVSRCMDLLSEMVSKAQTVPIGFSCWPGSGSSVVVPGVASTTK